ncbi:MAG: trypsin-like peptidase domain-containing protein [Rhodothermales bacterium]
MKDQQQISSVKILIGVGLVLVGLTTGILFMLIAGSHPENVDGGQRVVERVQLGNREAPANVPVLDSLNASLDPRTLNRMFRHVADDVTPAVVYIQVEVPLQQDGQREWYHNFDEDARRRFFQDDPLRQSVGSGVLISPQGYIVTNHHVVENAESIQVTLSDKRLYDARIVGTDPSTDLAVLKIEDGGRDFPAVRLGNSDGLQVGEWVLAIGNPFRLTSTVTAGIVSATGRQVNIIDGDFGIEDFIQTDAAINPGNSGGAVVNLNGELVGIATAIATESGSYEGYGFAVPANLMERVAGDLIEYGEVRRGYLGVVIQNVDAGVARRLDMEEIQGIYVNDVTDGGSAANAGIRQGDVIVSVDDRAVNAANELQSTVARKRPGDVLDIGVWREGSVIQFDVELLGRNTPAYERWFSELREQGEEEAPEAERAPPLDQDNVFELSRWGVGLRNLTARELNAFDVRAGAYVAYVENGSVADDAALPRDAVITEISGSRVESTEQAINRLEEAAQVDETVLIKVRRRDGISAYYEMEVPATAGSL